MTYSTMFIVVGANDTLNYVYCCRCGWHTQLCLLFYVRMTYSTMFIIVGAMAYSTMFIVVCADDILNYVYCCRCGWHTQLCLLSLEDKHEV